MANGFQEAGLLELGSETLANAAELLDCINARERADSSSSKDLGTQSLSNYLMLRITIVCDRITSDQNN